MKRVDSNFVERVYAIVAAIPRGRVVTYGQVATHAGASWAAWEVGQIAHNGPKDLPWHRVINKKGGLARGYTDGGYDGHRRALEAEGILVNDDYSIEIDKFLWQIPATS